MKFGSCPIAAQADFHYRGDGRGLLTQVASAFGVTATFDESVVSRQVRFDIGGANFYTAMAAACQMTHTFWTPLDGKQILLAAESAQNHRQFDRMALRTFYLPGVTSPQELNDIVNLLRNLFEIRLVTPQPSASTIVVRAPRNILDAATRLLEGLGDSRPQVMLDVHVYEITNSLTRNMGLQIPNNFQLFNIPAGALAALAGQNIQDLINQLISGGGINQANSQALSGLLAQLQSQQSSIFSQPLATFGGGLTLMRTEPGNGGRPTVAEREQRKNPGACHAASGPGHGCDVSRGLAGFRFSMPASRRSLIRRRLRPSSRTTRFKAPFRHSTTKTLG